MDKFDLFSRLILQRPSSANINNVLSHIDNKLKALNVGVNVKINSQSINQATQNVQKYNKAVKTASTYSDELANILSNATRRFAGISIATGTILGLVRNIKNAYSEAIQFEREMYKVAQANDATYASTKNLSKEILSLSKAYGTNALELAKTGTILSQAGFNARTTARSLKLLSQVNLAATFGSTEENVEGFIAILAQFGKEAAKAGQEAEFLEEKINFISRISKKYAIESSDIIEAVRKAGGSFEAAGGTIEEFVAAMTSIRATTRESASSIANGLKSIFTRIQRKDTLDMLSSLGVQLTDINGKFIGPIKAAEELARVLSVLDKGDVRFTQIAESIGGMYQVNRLITMLNNQPVVRGVLAEQGKTDQELSKDAALAMESTDVKLQKLRASFFDLIYTLTNSDAFKNVLDYLIKMADASINLANNLQSMIGIIGALSIPTAMKFGTKLGRSLIGGRTETIRVGGYATGGVVRGGKGGIDDVPAMLTAGEIVINKKDAQKNRALLLAINSGTPVSKFQYGGDASRKKKKRGLPWSRKGPRVRPEPPEEVVRELPLPQPRRPMPPINERIHSKTPAPSSSRGIDPDDLAINTLLPSAIQATNVTMAQIQSDYMKALDALVGNNAGLRQKLSQSLDLSTKGAGTTTNNYGKYYPDSRKISMNQKRYDPRVLSHELGHAVDASGRAPQASARYNSEIPGTINNLLVNAVRGLATRNANAVGMDDKNKEYRRKDREIFAELFASLEPEARKLLLQVSSSSTSMEHLDRSIGVLSAAIKSGSVTFGKTLNQVILDEASSIAPAILSQGSTDRKQINQHGGAYNITKSLMDQTLYLNNEDRDNIHASAMKTYTELIKKGMDGQKALDIAIARMTAATKKKTDEYNKSAADATNAARAEIQARNNPVVPTTKKERLQASIAARGVSLPGSGIGRYGKGGVFLGPETNNTSLSSAASISSPAVSNEPNRAIQTASALASAQTELSETTSFANANLLMMGSGVLMATDMLGLLSDSTKSAMSSALMTGIAVKMAGNAIKDASESMASMIQKTVSSMRDANGNLNVKSIKDYMSGKNRNQAEVSGGFLGKLAGKANALTWVFTGVGAAAGYLSAEFAAAATKLQEINTKILEEDTRTNSFNRRDQYMTNAKSIVSYSEKSNNVTTNALAGAAVGAAIGMVIPIVGPIVGSVVGGVAGLVYTYFKPAGDMLVSSAMRVAAAQYDSAQAITSFDNAVKNARQFNITGDSLDNLASKQFLSMASEYQRTNVQLEGMKNTARKNWDGSINSVDKKLLDDLSDVNANNFAKLQEASAFRISAIQENLNKAISETRTSEDLSDLNNTIANTIKTIRDTTYNATGGKKEDREKAAKEAEDMARESINKTIKTHQEQLNITQLINKAKLAELNMIKLTTKAMANLNEDARKVSVADKMIQGATTSYSTGVVNNRFSDLTNVKNLGAMIEDVRKIASTIEGGDAIGQNVINGTAFANELREKMTDSLVTQFNGLRTGGMGALETAGGVDRILSNVVSSYSSLSSDQRKIISGTIQKELSEGQFNIDSLQNVLNASVGLTQRQADVLNGQIEMTEQKVDKVRSAYDLLINALDEEASAREGLYNIESRNRQRIMSVMSRYSTPQSLHMEEEYSESRRNQRSSSILSSVGYNGERSSFGIGQFISQVNAQIRSNNNTLANGAPDFETRSKLATQNQFLANAASVAANELSKLADQSDRASDIMSKIERERRGRDYRASNVSNFVTGTASDRISMMEIAKGIQHVFQSGSMQDLPADLRKSVESAMREQSEFNPAMKNALNNALGADFIKISKAMGLNTNNDDFKANLKAVLDQPTSAEEKFIKDLKVLNEREALAQQELIKVQKDNSEAMRNLAVTLNGYLANQGAQQIPSLIGMQNRGAMPGYNTPIANQVNNSIGHEAGMAMQNVTNRLEDISVRLANMKMTHEVNVSGQLNIPGINKDIANLLRDSIANMVASEVKKSIENSNKSFRAA